MLQQECGAAVSQARWAIGRPADGHNSSLSQIEAFNFAPAQRTMTLVGLRGLVKYSIASFARLPAAAHRPGLSDQAT